MAQVERALKARQNPTDTPVDRLSIYTCLTRRERAIPGWPNVLGGGRRHGGAPTVGPRGGHAGGQSFEYHTNYLIIAAFRRDTSSLALQIYIRYLS